MPLRLASAAVATALALAPSATWGEPAPFMMRTRLDNRFVEGQPLVWDSGLVRLLGRDGALYEFKPGDAQESKKTGKGFVGYTSAEMQAILRSELGKRFELSTTSHFVVAQPRGRGADWAERLETLYRGFTHYMNVRGFHAKSPTVPLAAVVFANEQEYYDYSASIGSPLPPGVLGHYDVYSNRVYMYDSSSSPDDAANMTETVIHEATHQTAYNVGVHTRFAEQPRWLVEGLAMMFEAPGVWNAASLHTQAQRVNRYRLDYFRAASKLRPSSWIVQLVASDEPYQTTPLDAYAAGWALTFYLCEARPQEYSAYLAKVAQQQPFGTYTPQQRLADFMGVFGSDWELLAAQVQRFVATLP